MHYWRDVTRPAATRAVREAGLIPVQAAPFRDVKSLFPHIDKPTPLQLFCEEVALSDGPILFVIEDMTGAGKKVNIKDLAQSLLEWNDEEKGDRCRTCWAFDYYDAGFAAPDGEPKAVKDTKTETAA